MQGLGVWGFGIHEGFRGLGVLGSCRVSGSGASRFCLVVFAWLLACVLRDSVFRIVSGIF